MTNLEINKKFNLEMIYFLNQIKNNVKSFLSVPTLENLIILLDGSSYGVIGQLVKEANEDEYIVYKSPDILVKEELIRNCLIPESKRSNTINPNYTMIMYFKNKYTDPNERLNNFIDLALKCYANELM